MNHVTVTRDCPQCGLTATWVGKPKMDGGTVYYLFSCDGDCETGVPQEGLSEPR